LALLLLPFLNTNFLIHLFKHFSPKDYFYLLFFNPFPLNSHFSHPNPHSFQFLLTSLNDLHNIFRIHHICLLHLIYHPSELTRFLLHSHYHSPPDFILPILAHYLIISQQAPHYNHYHPHMTLPTFLTLTIHLNHISHYQVKLLPTYFKWRTTQYIPQLL